MDWEAFDALGKGRHGVVGTGDAARLGVSPAALVEHARRHELVRPGRGVVLVAGVPHTFEQCCMIAVVAAGAKRALVSRRAAANLLGMMREVPDLIEVVVPGDRQPSLTGLRLPLPHLAQGWRSSTLLVSDVCERLGIPVTCPSRTVVDLAAVLTLDELRGVVIDARQRRIVTLAQIRRRHDQIPNYRGRGNVTRVLSDLDEQTCDSMLEWDCRKEARRRGYRPYPKPFPFRCSDGVVINIDVAFPEAWVAGECHGLGAHSERRHLTTQHLRQNRAVADGWRPFLIDWTRLKRDPDGLFADLDALLAAPPPHPQPAQPAL